MIGRPEQRTIVQIEALQQLLLDEHGLRVSDAMGEYILKSLETPGTDPVPVIGGDSRTGVPVRAMIPLESIRRAALRQNN
jgi:hypothetical protein